jgi:hypothetical protein
MYYKYHTHEWPTPQPDPAPPPPTPPLMDTHLQVAHGLAVMGQRHPLIIDDAHITEHVRPPLGHLQQQQQWGWQQASSTSVSAPAEHTHVHQWKLDSGAPRRVHYCQADCTHLAMC